MTPMEYNGVQIKWYGHDTFALSFGGKTICIDPYQLETKINSDIVLISHNHFDHLSNDDLQKTTTDDTIIVAAKECLGQIKAKSKQTIGIAPGEEITVSEIKIKAVPAYNLDKINPQTGQPFHPKEDKKVGFVITMNDSTFYHAGDSDYIPEMNGLAPDVFFVPVSGTYVMTASEAANSVLGVKPRLAIPMHYGSIVGSKDDAESFKKLVSACQVQIPTKE
jgi:L-ascorbate metabolism protein UlaG (beta-lactamase superfamily)